MYVKQIERVTLLKK